MRYERTLQESELITEKAKARFDLTAEELERVLVQKEGESVRETAMQAQNRAGGGGAGGKRVIGKVAQKGGLLLKGKNPISVSPSYRLQFLPLTRSMHAHRCNGRRKMFDRECPPRQTFTERPCSKLKPCDRNTSISSYRVS